MSSAYVRIHYLLTVYVLMEQSECSIYLTTDCLLMDAIKVVFPAPAAPSKHAPRVRDCRKRSRIKRGWRPWWSFLPPLPLLLPSPGDVKLRAIPWLVNGSLLESLCILKTLFLSNNNKTLFHNLLFLFSNITSDNIICYGKLSCNVKMVNNFLLSIRFS